MKLKAKEGPNTAGLGRNYRRGSGGKSRNDGKHFSHGSEDAYACDS